MVELYSVQWEHKQSVLCGTVRAHTRGMSVISVQAYT